MSPTMSLRVRARVDVWTQMLKLDDFTTLLQLFLGQSGLGPSQDRTQSHTSASVVSLSADKESHTYMHRNSQHE